ncbi:hypothetical protein OQA88_13656 [Cercophora sp. LCS_1]
MCHATSQLHPCGHSGTQWEYCRESGMTGSGTAPPECSDRSWGNLAKSNDSCALAYCAFRPGTIWLVNVKRNNKSLTDHRTGHVVCAEVVTTKRDGVSMTVADGSVTITEGGPIGLKSVSTTAA